MKFSIEIFHSFSFTARIERVSFPCDQTHLTLMEYCRSQYVLAVYLKVYSLYLLEQICVSTDGMVLITPSLELDG